MKLIIDFYKSLDALNLIIFWGIIIVIILLLIFSFIMINKNKKLKKLIEKNNEYEEEIPLKKEQPTTIDKIVEENINKEQEKETSKNVEVVEEHEEEATNSTIEEENNFIAEEHVIEYKQAIPNHKEIINKDYQDLATSKENKMPKSIEMPTAPYQRNVLREMSLSQTSPIGINRKERTEEKKIEMAKDLAASLNNENTENFITKNDTNKLSSNSKNSTYLDNQIKKDLRNIENLSTRQTEIINNQTIEVNKETSKIENNNGLNDLPSTEIELSKSIKTNEINEKKPSETYLEEVSRKLSEAEIPDEIERTNYELQQEEEAIISYKELMEKKDTIQTIDEEEAVISIEELINRSKNKQDFKSQKPEDVKLYNLTETEENDNFIKELKQFRNDL